MSQLAEGIEETYRRIEANKANPVLIHLVPKQQALERAAAVQKTPKVSPLWGRPFVLKDNIDAAGIPTTAGCAAFAYTPERNARVVQKVLDAGAILVGKANMDQFATGLSGTRSPYGLCRNAFDPAYISGGSSAGAALAVALGMASFALGTDTAGSGRVPAAFNALVGLKPSRGMVSTSGVVPACRSLDCVAVLAVSCKEALEVLDAIEGPDPTDPYSRSARAAWFSAQDFRFAVPSQLEFHGDSDYARLFAQAILKLRQLGGTPIEVDYACFREAQELLYGPWVAERTALLEQHLEQMLPVTREIIEGGRRYSAVELFRAQQRLWELMLEARKLFQKADVLLTPTAPTIFRISDLEAKPIELNSRLGYYTQATNLLDLAAVSVPAGLRPDGLPFGIQLTGSAFSERALANLGARFLGEALKS